MDLEQFVAELTNQHDALVADFNVAQEERDSAVEAFRAKKEALVDFRQKYGEYLKAAEKGAVVVEE